MPWAILLGGCTATLVWFDVIGLSTEALACDMGFGSLVDDSAAVPEFGASYDRHCGEW